MRCYAIALSQSEGIEFDKKEALCYFKIAADKGEVISFSTYYVNTIQCFFKDWSENVKFRKS